MAEKPTYEELEQRVKRLEKEAVKYRKLFEEARDGIVLTDAETGIIIDCNSEIAKLVERKKSELLGQHQRILHPQDTIIDGFSDTFIKHRDGFDGQILDAQVITSNGEIKDVAIKANSLNLGNRKHLQGIFRDITEQKRAEQKIQQNEAGLKTLLCLYDMFDKPLEEIISFVVEECVKQSASELAFLGLITEDQKFMNAHLWSKQAMAQCTIEKKPVQFPIKDAGLWAESIRQRQIITVNDYSAVNPYKKGIPAGHVRLTRFMSVPLVIGNRVVAVIGVANKATPYTNTDGLHLNLLLQGFWEFLKRKQAEKVVRESEDKLRSLFNDALDMIHIVDEDYKIVDANPAELETMAYTRDEYIGKHILEIVHPDYQSVSKAALDSAFEGKEVKGLETAWITKHGKRIDVEINAVPQTAIGKIVSIRTIARNITERKLAEEEKRKLEAQFQKAQKFESIGTLAGGIAHDFNNLLMSFQGNTSLMLMDIDSYHPHYEMLKSIEKQIKSGVNLTSQLLGYASKGMYEVKPTNLNQMVEETSMTFGRTRKQTTIHRNLAEDLFAIEADQGQIEQILLNLFINASDAMPGGGDLYLETKNVAHKDMKSGLYKSKAGNYVKLTVRDTGEGIDKSTMERIFDPFFTTKEMGRGTGLGLASVYGIIKAHGGYIDVESKEKQGTTFEIYLPATTKRVSKAKKASEKLIKQTGTMLLVDDEAAVRKVCISILEKIGYRVLSAKDGQEAIELYRNNKDEIDIVLLDMIMPNMSGGEVYDRLKEINPEVKVLLSSGYSIDGEATEILNRGCDGFIQKPFDIEKLSAKISKVLNNK